MSNSTRCWQCGGSLSQFGRAPIFDTVGDGLRVHKVCKDDALKALEPSPRRVREAQGERQDGDELFDWAVGNGWE